MSLSQTLASMQALRGPVIAAGRAGAAEFRVNEPISLTDLPEQDLYQPRPIQGLTAGPVNQAEQPNTLDMTKTVLQNAGGEEKTVDELRSMIRTTYGVEPAKSLDQMLYKRASSGRGFYKTHEGRFGLTDLRKGVQIDTISMPSTILIPQVLHTLKWRLQVALHSVLLLAAKGSYTSRLRASYNPCQGQ